MFFLQLSEGHLRNLRESPGRFHPDVPKYHPHPVGDCGKMHGKVKRKPSSSSANSRQI